MFATKKKKRHRTNSNAFFCWGVTAAFRDIPKDEPVELLEEWMIHYFLIL